jgi:GDSL-like Lipase/Acylhydrolase family
MRKTSRVVRSLFNIGLIAFSIVAAIALSFLVDELLGTFGVVEIAGLVLPPRQRVKYETPEFVYEAVTNSLGFRDREFSAARTSTLRIVALGDSFTYGWGVAAEESWPKRLEVNLRAANMSVEIANLGLPGADPEAYAEIAARAIPILRPDLVIVGILQGDDLAQLGEFDSKKCSPHPEVSWRSRLRHLLPNLSQLVRRREAPGRFAPSVRSEWQSEVQMILDRASESDRKRFDNLDPGLREAFRQGQLNPPVLAQSFRAPGYFMRTMLPGPERQTLVENMSACLQKIRRLEEQVGGQVMVVAVPFGAYVSRRNFEVRRRLGFQLDESVLVSREMDEAIRLAAAAAGLQFVTVTEQFRAAPPAPPLFYQFDGHLTAGGHRLFADSIAAAVRGALDSGPGTGLPLQRGN